jgi:LysR family transcriptional regulator, transcription activator of glutamate synthase operon
MISNGMGVSLMLKQILLHFSDPRVAIVAVSPTVSTQISLCYRQGSALSDAAKHFLRCAEL